MCMRPRFISPKAPITIGVARMSAPIRALMDPTTGSSGNRMYSAT